MIRTYPLPRSSALLRWRPRLCVPVKRPPQLHRPTSPSATRTASTRRAVLQYGSVTDPAHSCSRHSTRGPLPMNFGPLYRGQLLSTAWGSRLTTAPSSLCRSGRTPSPSSTGDQYRKHISYVGFAT
jgi:hypothetical protein